MTFVNGNAIPGIDPDFNYASIEKFRIVEDGKPFNSIEVESNYFPIFPDPTNWLVFDIGQRKTSELIPSQPINKNDIVEGTSPSWLVPIPVSAPYVDGQIVGGQFPPVEGYVPPAPFKIIPAIQRGTALGAESTTTGIQVMYTPYAVFPEIDFISSNPSHFISHEQYQEIRPVSTSPGVNAWKRVRRLIIPTDVFPSNGGPRNNGYMFVNESIRARINKDISNAAGYGSVAIENTNWKQGSIEFTIKPTKSNCTIFSGSQAIQPTLRVASTDNGNGSFTDVIIPINKEYQLPTSVAFATTYDFIMKGTGGVPLQIPGTDFALSEINELTKAFAVRLHNGKIRVEYAKPYSDYDKKYIVLDGKTNLVDGNWHHIVINRPNKNTEKYPGIKYGGSGCLEIWVDGELEAVTYDITVKDNLPTPQLLFNDEVNVGWQNSNYLKNNNTVNGGIVDGQLPAEPKWIEDILVVDNYQGGISDFIFRQSYPLSPHEIKLNNIYSTTDPDKSRIIKSSPMTCSASFKDANFISNKKKILKLYWNSLLTDKEKMVDGLEFDTDSYDVYSYSVSRKNLINSSQTFNLDLNQNNQERFFFENVKTALQTSVFIFGPGIAPMESENPLPGAAIYTDFNSVDNRGFMIDTDSDVRIAGDGPSSSSYIHNLSYGGVALNEGDRILLTNQQIPSQNGIWIYNGAAVPLTRAKDLKTNNLQYGHVYVTDGLLADKTFVQLDKVNNIRTDRQTWIQIDNEAVLNKIGSYPIHTTPWLDSYGNQKLIDVNTDVAEDYDVIAFMNYPRSKDDIISVFETKDPIFIEQQYKNFINNLKAAVNAGKSLYVSSPMLAVDLGIVSKVTYIPQLLNNNGDAQSAAITPFEPNEPASSFFDTHRNMKYHLQTELSGLTNVATYIITDFITYSPNKTNSDYHIKYSYRPLGIKEGNEFYIPGLTTVPETLNQQLPGYLYNQKSTSDLPVFDSAHILMGTPIAKFSNNYYVGTNAVSNPYDDYINTIAVVYGNGKMFVNCVENAYAMSRADYNKGRIQNVTAGQNSETVNTAAWQYSTKRLNKKNFYDFSETSNAIGQTTPTNGGGGAIVQSQSHCSNGVIRAKTNKDDILYQSDLYSDFTEEEFTTTEIPVLSMTWLGLKWLAS